jgi:PAS domain S-box-containing protein
VEVNALRPGGEEFPVEMTISALKEGNRRTFHAFLLDISDRRAVERDREQRLEDLLGALRGSEQRFAVIVNAIADAVTIRGTDNRLLYANKAALDRLGLDSVEHLRASDPQALMDPYETVGEDGRPIALEDLPSVRVLRGESPEPLTLRSVDRRTGEEHWALLKSAPVRDAAGRIEAAVTIIEDITAAKRAALRSEFLVRATSILASSLDYQQTIRNVAGLAVPQIADWCAVDLFDEDGRREPVAMAHVDPQKLLRAERLRTYEPERPDSSHPVGHVWSTGESGLYAHITEEMLAAFAVDDTHHQLLREVGMCSGLVVPMRLSGRPIGALTLVSSESRRVFDRADMEFAQQIADRAALAVDNARQYRRRVEVARTLQNSLLPEALPDIPGWEIAAFYRPAGVESEVGGDFYDFWPVGDRWLMMIGDVTGKGVAAAAVTSLVRHTAWAASDFDPDPSAILKRVDSALKRRPALPLCTALCLSIEGDAGTVACGGHPPLLHVGEFGFGEVGVPGTLLGAFTNVDWPQARVHMQPGETLVAITDGVTDTLGRDGTRFGIERLRETLLQARSEEPDAIRARVLDALEGFQIGAQADDTAVVVMRFAGVPAARERPGNRNGAAAGIGQR